MQSEQLYKSLMTDKKTSFPFFSDIVRRPMLDRFIDCSRVLYQEVSTNVKRMMCPKAFVRKYKESCLWQSDSMPKPRWNYGIPILIPLFVVLKPFLLYF